MSNMDCVFIPDVGEGLCDPHVGEYLRWIQREEHDRRTERDAARREVEELRGQVERLTRERDYCRTVVTRRAEAEPWFNELVRLNDRIEELENEKRSGATVYRLAHEGEDVAEIARLRAENERLRADLDARDGAGFMAVTEIARLRAESEYLAGDASRGHVACTELAADNARLRALLKEALVPCELCHGGVGRKDGCEECDGSGYVPVEVEP